MNTLTLFGMEFSATAMATMFLTSSPVRPKLFMKCEQPIWAALVPGHNVVIAMRILGRPDAHALLFLVPVFNIYFFFKTVIELAQAF